MGSYRVGHDWSDLAAAAAAAKWLDSPINIFSGLQLRFSAENNNNLKNNKTKQRWGTDQQGTELSLWDVICSTCFCSVSQLHQLFPTPWAASGQASLSFTISWSWLRLMSIESVMPSNHLIFCHLLPSIFPSIRVFSNEFAFIQSYSCLGNPMDRGPCQATVHGVTRVRHDLLSKPPPHIYIIYMWIKSQPAMLETWVDRGRHGFSPWDGKIPWRRKWQPNPGFLPG